MNETSTYDAKLTTVRQFSHSLAVAWHGRRAYIQGLGFLHYGLSKTELQGSGQERLWHGGQCAHHFEGGHGEAERYESVTQKGLTSMVVCEKCGYDNELGRIFCHSCGAKLNLSEIKSPSQGGKSLAKKKTGSRKPVWRTINVLILFAVIAAVFLAMQVPNVRPISTSSEDLTSSDKKRFELDDAIARKTPVAVAITEGQLNAFIGTPGSQKSQGTGLEIIPTKLQLELGDGVVTAIFVGKIHFGGSVEKQLYLSYTGVPTIEGGRFVFKRVGGSLGSLPISPWLLEKTSLFDRYYAKVFASLGQEKQVLDSLSSISVSPTEVVLNYQPH
jgi:hypothetical protein